MYPLRLFLRPFVKECKFVSQSFAYSSATFVKKTNSAGIRRRMKVMDYTADDLEDWDDERFHDDELNVSAAERLFDMHQSETAAGQHRRLLAMYGRKYYKQKKEPPLLTWDDMEQIQQLYTKENWPVEELAKSFPASEVIIKKVVKLAYKADEKTKLKHDQKVSKNWELLKEGKLEISEELRQHCLKFTNRKAFWTSCKVTDDVVAKKKDNNVKGAFSGLLGKPRSLDKKKKELAQASPPLLSRPDDTDKKNKELAQDEIDDKKAAGNNAVMRKIKMKIATLEEERKQQLENIAKGTPPSDKDRAFVLGAESSSISTSSKVSIGMSQYHEPSAVTKVKSTSQALTTKWDSSGQSKEAARDALMAPIDKYPERITIPASVKKPGAIYRLEDCFYDESGAFLYRVPGLKL